ncbi:hypothetical protein CHELA20_53038 [Hyphomicrobiales bacterium]|nr:hypothetical protein CHELA41_21885 [Hyphomicrobiales bacterium]CAH1683450.1 hypothetical protein CHELA20_53038 [Hyphomicrobiales bacterium]
MIAVSSLRNPRLRYSMTFASPFMASNSRGLEFQFRIIINLDLKDQAHDHSRSAFSHGGVAPQGNPGSDCRRIPFSLTADLAVSSRGGRGGARRGAGGIAFRGALATSPSVQAVDWLKLAAVVLVTRLYSAATRVARSG